MTIQSVMSGNKVLDDTADVEQRHQQYDMQMDQNLVGDMIQYEEQSAQK